MKAKFAIIIMVGLLLAMAGAIYFNYYRSEGDILIGGQTDDYGCLTAAGYSWDDYVGACTRSWELDMIEKEVAKSAVSHLSYRVTIVDIKEGENGYNISVQRNDNRELINMKIDSSTKNYCTERGDACIKIYAPVCGFKTDGSSQTYGNSCVACSDKDVEYWIDGEC
jgi:hypothetical protein